MVETGPRGFFGISIGSLVSSLLSARVSGYRALGVLGANACAIMCWARSWALWWAGPCTGGHCGSGGLEGSLPAGGWGYVSAWLVAWPGGGLGNGANRLVNGLDHGVNKLERDPKM